MNLYASILAQARGTWANHAPQHELNLVYGGIRISMFCPQQPIPWTIIGNFAERLLQITDGGWTGLYQIVLSHAETEVTVGMHLTLVDEVG